ncbi:pali-domain-containing protein [Atractiella rhizophila]|nr:pali-domain-containing protein [Atractiella rhizophila]
MAISPNFPGTLVVLVGTALLVVVSLSVPIIKSVFFLKANLTVTIQQFSTGGDITLGTWGLCIAGSCSKAKLGYDLDADSLLNIGGLAKDALGGIPNSLIKGLTYALVIHPVAAAFGGIASILGLLSLIREFSGTCFTTCFASFAASFAWLAFIFDIITFSIAKSRINSSDTGDSTTVNAQLGNAIWLTLTAAILLSLSGCFFGCGRCCIRQRSNRNPEHEKWKPSMDPAFASNMRQDAIAAEKARANTGYVPNFGNSFGRSKSKNGKDLPAFAEYGNNAEQVPLTAMRESDDEERVSGVGMGYGRGPNAGRPNQSPSRGYGNQAPYDPYAAQPSPRRQQSGSTASSREPFRSMYDGQAQGPPPPMPRPQVPGMPNGYAGAYAPPPGPPGSNYYTPYGPPPPGTRSPPQAPSLAPSRAPTIPVANPYEQIAALPKSSNPGTPPSIPSSVAPPPPPGGVSAALVGGGAMRDKERQEDTRSSVYSADSHYSAPPGEPPASMDGHGRDATLPGLPSHISSRDPSQAHQERQGSQATLGVGGTPSSYVSTRTWPNPYEPARPTRPPSY